MAQEKTATPVTTLANFLLDAPLYEEFEMGGGDEEFLAELSGRTDRQKKGVAAKLDGYCPNCKRDTTYSLSPIKLGDGHWADASHRFLFCSAYITCARESWHTLHFWFFISGTRILKVGQHPSLADVANSELRAKYKAVLKGSNWSELYKAIGLAAHGEGIGSFVYLRRVLERLVQSRFDTFKSDHGWREDEFKGLRMDEKIQFLKEHLPAYLVETRKIYGIFSQGVHELNNDQCLAFFEVGKRSILLILQDDLVKQEELAARKELQEAIAKFAPGDKSTE
jgi:hypothetical protein